MRLESPSDRLTRRMNQYPSESRLLLTRNLSFGSAAAALAVVSQVIQVGAKEQLLQIAVIAGCVAMPLWVGIGTVIECLVFLGKQSYPFVRTAGFRAGMGLAVLVSGMSLLVEIGASAWYLSQIAAYAFIGSIGVSFVFVMMFWEILARWWYREGGPGAKETEHDT
jgi:hypothetical protein